VLRRLASEGYSVPVVLITGEGSEKIAVDAFRLGVQDYLLKPVDIDSLSQAITRALAESRLRREKEHLTARLKQQVTWLTALSQVAQVVTSSLEVDEVLRRIVEASVNLTQAQEGFLALVDDASGQLYLRAIKNVDQPRSRTLRLRVSDSLVGEVASTGRPMRLSQKSIEQPVKVVTGVLVHSLLYVPVFSKDRVLGVLAVNNRGSGRYFTEVDETVLTWLADYAAVAIENAQLYEKAQQEIDERARAEAQIRASLIEKEVLLQEVHHRVKNNLQVISSLLNLQARQIGDPHVAKLLQDSQYRIRSMALIHEKLYRSHDLARIDMADYVRDLVTCLFQAYGTDVRAVTPRIRVERVLLGIDLAVPCGLILNELISNALKHAFPSGWSRPDGVEKEIRVELYQNGDDRLALLVSDNGVGFPANFDFRHATSLGLQLVNTLVNQINGAIEMRSHDGTEFRVMCAVTPEVDTDS
jgi:two-component sensor histidine kinase